MGFDLYGIKAVSEKGEYFRNNVWYWRPLWDFVSAVASDILTAEDISEGQLNNGHKISASKARAIAERLNTLLASGLVKEYELRHDAKATPKGELHEQKIKEIIAKTGSEMVSSTDYPFSEDNVREFAEFCAESGGFTIS